MSRIQSKEGDKNRPVVCMQRLILLLYLYCRYWHYWGGKDLEYEIDLNIDPNRKKYSAYIKLNYSLNRKDIGEFLIHRSSKIKSILYHSSPIPWFLQEVEMSFIPEAKKLVLNLPEGQVKDLETTLEFYIEGVIDKIKSELNQVSSNYIELNIYSPWYPVPYNLPRSRGRISIKGLEEFYVVKGNKDLDMWVLNLEGNDNYVIAYKNPKLQVINYEGLSIRVIYDAGIACSECLQLINRNIKDILSFYGRIFHTNITLNEKLDIVIAPREKGGGYCRDNLIVMSMAKLTEEQYALFFAHEISHLWFKGAEVLSWEDWLNESFAEYISLLYIEEKFGKDSYDAGIEKLKLYSSSCPPIKGSDRNSEEGSRVRYKGTLLLHKLRQHYGLDAVIMIMNTLIQLEEKTTQKLVEAVGQKNSEIAIFLDKRLEE